MTLLSEIQQAQSQWLYPLFNKRILIRTPIALVQQYNPNHLNLQFFDPTNYVTGDNDNYVYMVMFPEYESEDEFLADRKYKPASNSSAIAVPSTLRRGFRAVVRQSSAMYFNILQQLVVSSETSSFQRHTPIRVIDSCLPENKGNTMLGGGDIGTVRYGRIDISKRPGGLLTSGLEDHCISKWEFKFSEAELRY